MIDVVYFAIRVPFDEFSSQTKPNNTIFVTKSKSNTNSKVPQKVNFRNMTHSFQLTALWNMMNFVVFFKFSRACIR